MASDTAVGGLCVNSPRDLREKERVAVDNNAFWGVWGVWGVYPLKKHKGTALCIKAFFLPCANSIDFLLVSYRLSINFL